MTTIYRSPECRRNVHRLYDKQLRRMGKRFRNRYVMTSFGKTHLIETGNFDGIPLLVFHGGNSMTSYTLLTSGFLFPDFHIYAVDTIGHPGKSAENGLSPWGDDYGEWAGEVIAALGFEKMRCFGGSFGAGIIAKAMCAAPERIERAALYVPAGIKNAPAWRLLRLAAPMLAFRATGNDAWLKKTLLPMAVEEKNLDRDTLETSRVCITNARVRAGMPSNADPERIAKCRAEVLLLAAEKDCFFPAKLVIPQAQKIIGNCTTCLLEGRGHLQALTEQEQKKIVDFLKQ